MNVKGLVNLANWVYLMGNARSDIYNSLECGFSWNKELLTPNYNGLDHIIIPYHNFDREDNSQIVCEKDYLGLSMKRVASNILYWIF